MQIIIKITYFVSDCESYANNQTPSHLSYFDGTHFKRKPNTELFESIKNKLIQKELGINFFF